MKEKNGALEIRCKGTKYFGYMQILPYKNIFFARKMRVCLHICKKSCNFDLLPHLNGDPFEFTVAPCGAYVQRRVFFRKG